MGRLVCSTLAATHLDAPFHHRPDGATIDQVDLDASLGPAVVMAVALTARHITTADLPPAEVLSRCPRLLVRTSTWTDAGQFPAGFPTLAAGVAGQLARSGVRLLVVDVPSVDVPDSKSLPIHHELADAGISMRLSLELSDPRIPLGVEVHLTALPLRLVGGDASPVRAVLTMP